MLALSRRVEFNSNCAVKVGMEKKCAAFQLWIFHHIWFSCVADENASCEVIVDSHFSRGILNDRKCYSQFN